jgi:hypothetical protein
MFSEILSFNFKLIKHLKMLFSYPFIPPIKELCFGQKILNDNIEQCNSYVIIIIFWPRDLSLGSSEALFIHDILRL